MKGHRHPPPPSRHARDVQVLRAATQTAQRRAPAPGSRPPARAAAGAVPFTGYTVNWQAGPEEPLLAPRQLGPAELPEFPQPAVRALIDCTARGQPTSAELRQQLLTVDAATLAAAIRAGIQRWHTYQPRQASHP